MVAKSCHERALGFLAVRPRSRKELEVRLRAAGFEEVEVADVCSRLEGVGLIDDEAFARAMAEYQFGSRKAGRRAVTSALIAKGVSSALVAAAVGDSAADEEERAFGLASSRAARMGGLDPAKAFGRLTSLLMRRGYAPETARNASRRALDLEMGSD
jgi:regulatory protein